MQYIGGREYLLVWPSRMEDGVIYKELFSFVFKVTFFWVFVDSLGINFKQIKHDVPMHHIETFNSTNKLELECSSRLAFFQIRL
jgi:hypothetical protein